MNTREMLNNFPNAIEETMKYKVPKITGKINHIVVCGMGGSGISGDILRDYLKYETKIPVTCVKTNKLPRFVDRNTLVFAITYSGKTEETLSCIRDAKRRRAKLVVISSKNTKGWVNVPSGLLPRMGLPYLFFSVLMVMEKSKLIRKQTPYIRETIRLLRQFNKKNAENVARKISKTPVIYAPESLACVATRMATQINENAKMIAPTGIFSELNHNQIESDYRNFNVIIFRDKEDKATQRFIRLAKHIIKNYIEIKSKGRSHLAHVFYAIYFGDWISVYLAKRRKKNPMKMPAIDYIKSH